jgi:phenylalanyl-tRNA synthetase alpha chain
MEKKNNRGHRHPITQVIDEISSIFSSMGFEIADGPEIETEHYNFDSLRMFKDHPARDMQDTFWLQQTKETVEPLVLRTHISSLQVRYMEAHKPPFRMLSSGRVYRREATDATHEAQYHYTEGLVVERGASLATLRGTLEMFLQKLFQSDVRTRFRPAFFPFVEPGVEVDMSCIKCGGKGGDCSVCKGTGWVEILGAGIVHPQVLENGGIDSREWRGFAFGLGTSRLTMFKYGIDDIRLLYNGDLRLVNQF